MPRLEYFCRRPQLLLEDTELISLIKGTSMLHFKNDIPQELLEAVSICELYLTISFMCSYAYIFPHYLCGFDFLCCR